MSISQKIYDSSPYIIQNALLNLYSLSIHFERYGKKFINMSEELSKTQWYREDEIFTYQSQKLKSLLGHAYNTVPYYRDLYKKHYIHPDDIKDISDLYKLPYITKDDVRKYGAQMISSSYNKNKLVHGHTSGTTGTPLSFYWDNKTCVLNNAVDWRQKEWAGVKYGDRIAMLLGRTVVPVSKTKPPFWQLDRFHNMLWMSSFHLSDEYLHHYLAKLKQFKPVAIEGYPSTIYILARFLKSIGEVFPVKAIFTSSETLFPIQKSLIEQQFLAPVFDFYGMAERVAFATQCSESHEYHLNFEYAVNEIVDLNGNSISEGGQGYLVGTSLSNYGMPFIRYMSNDITSFYSGKCKCGRSMLRFNGITTKDEDIVVTPDGKLISSSVLTHPFKPLESVEESQIVQTEINKLLIKIVPGPEYKEEDTNYLRAAMQERVGELIKIDIEFVESIPRSASGKFRWVISKVPLPI